MKLQANKTNNVNKFWWINFDESEIFRNRRIFSLPKCWVNCSVYLKHIQPQTKARYKVEESRKSSFWFSSVDKEVEGFEAG